jgi:hypothetical protein
MTPKITVVLNVFKRSKNFERQISAIKSQSIKPLEVLVWENGTESVPEEFRSEVLIARSTSNLGVWARFAYALNANGDYVCMFDDDTIPGSKWLENCYKTMLKTPGLLGTRGVIFENKHTYSLHSDIGLYAPNLETEEVDIVGHSWFFKTSWLSYYWREYENRFPESLAGEDIHFSYSLQKHLNLPTLVPPHPPENMELWGSMPDISKELGAGKESISQSPESLKRFERALQHYRKLNFKTISEKQQSKSKHPSVLYILIQRFPKISHRLAKATKRIRKG